MIVTSLLRTMVSMAGIAAMAGMTAAAICAAAAVACVAKPKHAETSSEKEQATET